MPLTRRVQVFISEEASEKFDLLLAAHKLGPTALIETLILRADPLDDFVQSAKAFNKRAKGFEKAIKAGAKKLNERFAAHDEALKSALDSQPASEPDSPDGRKPVSPDVRKPAKTDLKSILGTRSPEDLQDLYVIKPCPRHSPKFCEPDCRYRK